MSDYEAGCNGELPVDPASPNIVEDLREKLDAKAAVVRGELWELMGFPQSPTQMSEDIYQREYRGRRWFKNKQVMEQTMRLLKILICPKCRVEKDHESIVGTQMYLQVEDDVMTVFKAVGHFTCHRCGFEEYHPLKHDPRQVGLVGEQAEYTANQMLAQQMIAMRNNYNFTGLKNAATQSAGAATPTQLAQRLQSGMAAGMGPVYGMTEEEKISLQRLYNQVTQAASPPPPIVQSREEAEMLLKLSPIERRQSIIQKLRDLGKI